MPSIRSRIALAATCALLASHAFAETSSDHVLRAPIQRRGTASRQAIYKRDTQSVMLKNEVNNGQYTMNVSVGTPPQTVTLQLDTGSTDVWFLTPGGCSAAQANPETSGNFTHCGGTYDLSASSTGKLLPQGAGNFHVAYEDTTGAQGDYFSDTLQIGSWSLKDYTMGQALQANTTPGLIGVGFDTLESIVGDEDPSESSDYSGDSNSIGYSILSGLGFDPSSSSSSSDPTTSSPPATDPNGAGSQPQTYPAVLSSLLDAGYIKTRAFSLWLDDLDQSTGTIMFGGFDTAKFQGERLTMLPMIEDYNSGLVDRYQVALTSVGVTIPGSNGQPAKSNVQTSSDYAVAATLDSGTSISDCPEAAFNAIAAALGAQEDDTAGGYVVDCSLALTAGSVDFQFGGTSGPVVAVPFSEIVIPLVDIITGAEFKGPNGKSICQLGLNPLDDMTASIQGAVLGDTFLRSAYVYYNLDMLSIGIAQTAFDSTNSNVVEVTNNVTLPSQAVSAQGAVSVPTPTATPTDNGETSLSAGASASDITARPATTFNAGAITGAATSYANLPTVAGNPSARVSAELKGIPLPGDEVSAGNGFGVHGMTSVIVGLAGVVAGVMLL